MSKLKQRAISAALFAPIVLGSIYFSDWSFQGLWLFVSIVCAFELSAMLDKKYGTSSPLSTVLKTAIPSGLFLARLVLVDMVHSIGQHCTGHAHTAHPSCSEHDNEDGLTRSAEHFTKRAGPMRSFCKMKLAAAPGKS